MSPGAVGQAIGLFTVTNVDDILVLALFFARGAGDGDGRRVRRIVAGQYLGFAGILAVAVAASSGEVAAVTFANGGDNIGVYVPVFTAVGVGGTAVHVVVFLVLVAVWCAAGWFFATRPLVARALSRWGHVLLPLALITIGVLILVGGGAFGL